MLRKIATTAPAELKIWQSGNSSLIAVLLEVSRRRLADQIARLQRGEPGKDDSDVATKWGSATAFLTEWAFLYADQTLKEKEPDPRDAAAAVDMAIAWRVVDIAVTASRAERAKVTYTKRGFRIDPFNNPRVEVLDLFLEGKRYQALQEPEAGPDLSSAFRYLNMMRTSTSGMKSTVPRWATSLFARRAQNRLEAQLWEIPRSTDVGGLTVDEIIPMLGALIGISELGMEVFARYPSVPMANPAFRRSDLEQMIARYCPNTEKVNLFIDLLIYKGQKGRSPLSAPLIKWGTTVIVTPHLLHDSLLERMILRAASADPSKSGRLGVSLGNLCSQWTTRLREIPGARLAEGVKVFDAANNKLGDLDIVALDPERMHGLIVEAKWPVDARTLSDVQKQEIAIDKGRSQVERLRGQIRSDTKFRFPPGWPNFDSVHWTWIVGTARFLDSRKTQSTIPSTSLEFVETLLPVPSLQSLLDLLNDSPLPTEGTDFRMGWEKVKVGRHAFFVRRLEMLETTPDRFFSRLSQIGK